MPSTKHTAAELRRERGDLAAQLAGILDSAEGGVMSEAQEARYDELYTRQGALEVTIRRLEQQEALDGELRSTQRTIVGAQGPDRAGAEDDAHLGGSLDRAQFMGYAPAGVTVFDRQERERRLEYRLQEAYGEGLWGAETFAKTNTKEYRDAFRAYIRGGGAGALGATELRTLQEGLDPSGGFLVPEDLQARIFMREPAPTRISGRVNVIPTMRDRIAATRVVWTTDNIYTTGMRVTWTGESPASATVHRVTDPVFGQLAIDVHTAMMSLPISLDLVEDASYPLLSVMTAKFGETVDLLRDNMAINGSGVGQPHGILENPGGTDEPAITASGSTAAIIPNGLQDIVWDVPEQYEENSAWVFNKNSTGKSIAKMVDDNNRYLWQPYEQSGLIGGRRADLLGYPVVMSAFMPNVSATTYPIVFGDLRGYTRVDRVGLSVQVLRERYAEENQVLLLGRIRLGGDVTEGYRMRIQRVSAS